MARVHQTFKLEEILVNQIVNLVDSKKARNKTHVVETALEFFFESMMNDEMNTDRITNLSDKVKLIVDDNQQLKNDIQLLKFSLQKLLDLNQAV